MTEIRQNKKISVPGVIITVLVTLGFLWAAVQWYNRYDWPPKLTVTDMQTNEVHAFENLKLIAQAQEKYKVQDWDGNGEKTYADYFVHLWTTVDKKNDPVLIELIPRKLGFAMGPAEAVDGYYFVDLHSRVELEKRQKRKLNYEKEWAVVGVPAAPRKTGFLLFMTDNSGQVFAKNTREVPLSYPGNPLLEGWTKIESIQYLKDLQKTIDYTPK
jgi:hypothetical protein